MTYLPNAKSEVSTDNSHSTVLGAAGRLINTVYNIFEKEIDTSIENNISLNFANPFVTGGRDVLYVTATTDQNNTKVAARFSGVQIRVT